MTEREAAMAVVLARGVGPMAAARLRDRFGSLLGALLALERNSGELPGVTSRVALALRRCVAEGTWEAEAEFVARAGARFAVPGDLDYPEVLLEIAGPPVGIFISGECPGDLTPMVGIVGSRGPTHRGTAVATEIAADLARAGVTVVSGLARGIDTRAHSGAMEAGGRTVAVLGCGLSCVYPPENAELALAVSEQGALVSEFPMRTEPLPGHFPRRNRIISGLSAGVVVIEAAARSGALITAARALEQGREVFAVPGPVDEPLSAGPNRLIKAGARLTEDAGDVLDELERAWGPFPVPRPGWRRSSQAGGIDEAGCLLELLSMKPLSVDELVGATGSPVSEVLSALLKLELSGHAERAAGGRFIRGARARAARGPGRRGGMGDADK